MSSINLSASTGDEDRIGSVGKAEKLIEGRKSKTSWGLSGMVDFLLH
jgi:hypothetical protein